MDSQDYHKHTFACHMDAVFEHYFGHNITRVIVHDTAHRHAANLGGCAIMRKLQDITSIAYKNTIFSNAALLFC